MSASKTPLSRQIEGYSHIQQNYGNIKVENPSNNDFQFRLNYLEKHFNLVFSFPIINILARTTNQYRRRRPGKIQVPRRNSQPLFIIPRAATSTPPKESNYSKSSSSDKRYLLFPN